MFHVLLGSRRDDIADRAELLPRLVAAGADLNLRDARGTRPLALLVKSPPPPGDAQLAPLWDVLFGMGGLVLTEPTNQWDHTILDQARMWRRTQLVERIEAYLTEHGEAVPPVNPASPRPKPS